VPNYCSHHLLQSETFHWEQEKKGYLKIEMKMGFNIKMGVRAQQRRCLPNETATNQ